MNLLNNIMKANYEKLKTERCCENKKITDDYIFFIML